MRGIGRFVPVVVLAALVLAPAQAQEDNRFAVRFGVLYLDPTSDTENTTLGKTEFDDGYGGEADFEWYFVRNWGLEGSIGTVADVDVDDEDDTTSADGVTITPITVGLNFHIVRNEKIDWYVGAVAGMVLYGDFEYEDTSNGQTTNYDADTEATFGVQTAVDFNIGRSWAVNVGLKYLAAEAEASESASPVKVDIDPILVRAMGVFRW